LLINSIIKGAAARDIPRLGGGNAMGLQLRSGSPENLARGFQLVQQANYRERA
jgi:hypothetical protein